MTMSINPAVAELTIAENTPGEENLWSRILYHLGTIFGRLWEHLNEDMGPLDGDDDCYYPTGGCCCL
ncbi:MAG: hypothetical protein ACE5Q6_09790 [Dehalococcoidia bacterium]